jgi:molecular chaperone HtpG
MSETIGFKTDVKRVMDIIIRSLYQHEDVFLRELISNASDALNKVRIKTLTSEKVYQSDTPLKIQIIPDSKNKTLTIRDTGIGMTKEELVNSLGTIARSGTLEFLQQAENTEDFRDLIGQFGVGFYSAYLVADKVIVRTRSWRSNAKSYEWISSGEDSFTITQIEKEDRGTDVVLYLKEDNEEFLDEYKIKQTVKKYSDFVNFQIEWIPEESEEDDESEAKTEEEEDEEKDTGPIILNSQKALWRKSPDEIKDEEYIEFYKHVSNKWDEPLLRLHIRAETPIEYYAIIYIPKTKNPTFMPDAQWGLKLYSKKILIQENNQDLIPEYFRFLVGVVDAEDLPLNVSREVVQNSRLMNQIRKHLQKKIIEEIDKLAEKDKEKYLEFHREYGVFLKEGIAQNDNNKDKLVSLLRFHSTRDDVDGRTGAVSLEDYIVNMKSGQDKIYYLNRAYSRSNKRESSLGVLSERRFRSSFNGRAN